MDKLCMTPKNRILRVVLAMTLATPTIAQAEAVGTLPVRSPPRPRPKPLSIEQPPRPPYRPDGLDKPNDSNGWRTKPNPRNPDVWNGSPPAGSVVSDQRNHVINAISKSLNTPFDQKRIQVRLLYSNIPKLIFANSGPLKFGKEFFNGSKDPDKYFKKAVGKNNQLVKEWTKTSTERKVFFIGSGADTQEIMDLRAYLEKQGFKAFFYKACEPLCLDAIVGAFFITSGYVYIHDSRQGSNSRYIKVESKITSAISNGQLPLIIDTEDVKKASKAGGELSAVALVSCYFIKCQTDICRLNGTPPPCCAIPFPACPKP